MCFRFKTSLTKPIYVNGFKKHSLGGSLWPGRPPPSRNLGHFCVFGTILSFLRKVGLSRSTTTQGGPQVFCRGRTFLISRGGGNRAKILFFAHFKAFLRSRGGQILPPPGFPGGASLTNIFPGGGTCPPLVVCADATAPLVKFSDLLKFFKVPEGSHSRRKKKPHNFCNKAWIDLKIFLHMFQRL